MTRESLAETIAANLARAICAEGALGSPFALHRLSGAIGRLSEEGSSLPIAAGSAYLMEVCRALFVARNPRLDCAALRNREVATSHASPDLFRLSGRAIANAVFGQDWDRASALFDLALQHAANFHSPLVRQALLGLKERYVLLPQTGAGVRETGSSQDILWRLNRAEALFCRGDLVAAQTAVESILAKQPTFGWARLLLLRLRFVQEDFQGARAILLSSEVGSIGAGEELAWETLIPGAEHGWPPAPPSRSSYSLGFSHIRLPRYFQALSCLLRGDTAAGLTLLKSATRAGEPSALMAAHDPVIQFALRSASADGVTPSANVSAELQMSTE